MLVGRVRTSVMSISLLAVIGVLVACSAVLIGASTALSVSIAIAVVITVGGVGLRFFTPLGQIIAAQKKTQNSGDASDLLRLRLDRAQYGSVQQTLNMLLPEDCVAKKGLVNLVKQLGATQLSINLVRNKAGVDVGQQQLLDSTTDFIIAKVGQVQEIHRHNHPGRVTEKALNTIARQSANLTRLLLLCKTELVEASGRDSWDADRLRDAQKAIQNVATAARSLNRDPFEYQEPFGEDE